MCTTYIEPPFLNDAIEHSLTDLRTVKQMLQVAEYFTKNIDFARENKIKHFIIDYDENYICQNIVKTVNCKYRNSYNYD